MEIITVLFAPVLSVGTWILAFVGIVIFIIVFSGIISYSEGKKREEERAAMLQKHRAARRARIEAYNAEYASFVAVNGKPDLSVVIIPETVNGAVYVYEERRKVFINGHGYDFQNILGCTYTDKPTVIKGDITAVTKSKTGSVIGRSIVGDMVAGPAGAIIGGTTGGKETRYTRGNDETVHNYTVYINVGDIRNPVEKIDTKNDEALTMKIVATINQIISRKQA